ncbi:hypothetical protein FQA39_LY12836 [Lamprigera yunnana]|nr:hypothetical protein FQA39_LY12836 [Lamprigera yunnana]
MKKDYIHKNNVIDNEEYITLNAKAKIMMKGFDNFQADRDAADDYVQKHVLPNTFKFDSIKERIEYLVENQYYDEKIIDQYTIQEIDQLTNHALSYNHHFPSFMGALKFFSSYALKTFDNKYYLETYEDRVVMNALFFGGGDIKKADDILKQMMLKRFQPATPTFLNAGKKQRGEYISCYLLRTDDNMESICRVISTSLQLSKRGGGVAIALTNLRELGSPIKNIENQSSGIVPIMKLLEDSFSYANQLGQRQGAGAVYLHAHHPDVLTFLDTKRENADEKIRIKSLSLGLVIPDITFELAKNNEQMALFSPYDVEKVYGKPMSDISITKEYQNLIDNPKIKKTYIDARRFFQTIAELHFESGYPYIMFDDTMNNNNAHPDLGRIIMSNLCSEIAQVNTISTYKEDLSFDQTGQDVCCNLGSINIAKAMESGNEFEEMIYNSILALDHVSRNSNISSAPSIEEGNKQNLAVGLGAMNLHGFLATNHIFYNSNQAVDFTNIFFYVFAYNAFKASNKLSKTYGKFNDFDNQHLLMVHILKSLANSHLMAIAPTGSISYLSSCTPSLQPIVSPIEVRKEGKLGRVYVPAYNITFDNMEYYTFGAYEIGPDPIIDIVSAAQKHIDQAISLTLFMTDKATTRDLNKAYIKAFKQGCKSIYYIRIRQDVLEDSENYECDSCVI